MVPTKRSAIAFARGARTDVLMIWMSMAVNTASKAAVNLASRSRIRNRSGDRRPEDLNVDGFEDGVEGGGELAVAVADQEPETAVGVVEVYDQVARLLGQPRSGRVCGDAQDVHPPGGVLDDEERVEPVQADRVEMEDVAGEDRLGLRVNSGHDGRCPAAAGPSSAPPSAPTSSRSPSVPASDIHAAAPAAPTPAVGPVQARPRVGSPQHGDLVAQHEQLDVLGRVCAAKQGRPTEELAKIR